MGYTAARYGHVMFPENVYEPALKLAELLLEGVGKGKCIYIYFFIYFIIMNINGSSCSQKKKKNINGSSFYKFHTFISIHLSHTFSRVHFKVHFRYLYSGSGYYSF